MAVKIPRDGLRKNDVAKMLAAKQHVKINVVHDSMFQEKNFKVLVNVDARQYTLYNFRGDIKRFASINSVYILCQELVIPEFDVIVEKIRDGV